MRAEKISISKELPSYATERGWLFGEPTKLIDRFQEDVEEIYLPQAITRAGQFRLTLEYGESRSHKNSYKRKILDRLAPAKWNQEKIEDDIILDLRQAHPENWAHAITNHLPVALLSRASLFEQQRTIKVVLPKEISQKINELFKLSGFAVLNTDRPVAGEICRISVTPWIAIRGIRAALIKEHLAGSGLQKAVLESRQKANKIFVSRKDTRKLVNEGEVETYLADQGYRKVYLEDYALADQIALLVNAEQIVAVHGAALGPLIFKSLFGERPYFLLEIFSPAHITNVYRVIADQTGGSWVGVRGNLWPGLLEKNADFAKNMKDFAVSLLSLQYAMAALFKL